MKIIHVFRSGNCCALAIPESIARQGLTEVDVEWTHWPPSHQDKDEWSNEFYPNKVVPALEAVARKTVGPGCMVEVAPGLRVWVSGEVQ